MLEIQVEQLISGIWETLTQVGGEGGKSQVRETAFGQVEASVIQVPFWRIESPVVPASEHQTQDKPYGFPRQTEQLTSLKFGQQ